MKHSSWGAQASKLVASEHLIDQLNYLISTSNTVDALLTITLISDQLVTTNLVKPCLNCDLNFVFKSS